MAGVREPDADLDRLAPLVAPAVGLDLGLLLAQQLRPGQEPDRLDPEPAEVAVADAEPPPPGVVDGVEHRLARADELVEDDRQLAVGAGQRRVLGQDQRGRLLARGLEEPEAARAGPARSGRSSPRRRRTGRSGCERPSTVSSGRNAVIGVAHGGRVARLGQLDRQERSPAASPCSGAGRSSRPR